MFMEPQNLLRWHQPLLLLLENSSRPVIFRILRELNDDSYPGRRSGLAKTFWGTMITTLF